MTVTATITNLTSKEDIRKEWNLLHLDICKEVNKIPWATITLSNEDPDDKGVPISDRRFFKPGAKIIIKLRYENEDSKKKNPDITVFKGVVVKQTIKANLNDSTLSVELKDESFKLVGQRKNKLYKGSKDNAIIKKIITRGGLAADKIGDTKSTHGQLVQYYCSDWDFMLTRCEANGLLVKVDDGEISALNPDKLLKSAPSLTIDGADLSISSGAKKKYDIYNLEMEADIRDQYKEVSAVYWDVKKQEISDSQKAAGFSLKQGLNPEQFPKKIGKHKCHLQSLVPESFEEMKVWAGAKMMKDRLSMLKGRFLVKGNASIKPLDILEIKKIGNKFNGKTIITGVRHQVSEKGWQIDIQFGLNADWFSNRTDITAPPAAGLLPGVNGLQVGVAEAFEEDKGKRFRIKVKIPAFGEEAVWARLASFDAGNNRGSFFIPEEGDEVVVGFFNDDPRHPVILGSLYNPKNEPPKPFKLVKKNPDKGIVTKGGMKILFNDKEKTVEISTSSKNRIFMKDSDSAGIKLEDKNGNKFEMNNEGITLSSEKDITIDSKNSLIQKIKELFTKTSNGADHK